VIRNHVRAMMTHHKILQISIRAFLFFGIVYAMHESSFKPTHFEQRCEVALAHAHLVRDLQNEISTAQGSKREWLVRILAKHEEMYGKNTLIIPRVVIARSQSPQRVSGDLAPCNKKMVLVPSARSAFVSYGALAKNSSAASK
jgi:hypothetical protein